MRREEKKPQAPATPGSSSPLTPHSSLARLVLKPGREKSLERRRPWVFSGAVAKVQGKPESG
ncbi:MAG: 23S rRNA (cytosine(1962)-C(5))-methyltransferase RlmI, partial [Gammaproteobacteria bacterium]